MNCRAFMRQLPVLLDRDPDPALKNDMMDHAGACLDCGGQLDAAMSALRAVSPPLRLKASPDLKERTMKHILTLESLPSNIRIAAAGRKTWIRRPLRYAVSAAAILTVLAAYSVLTFENSESLAFADVLNEFANVSAGAYTTTTFDQGKPHLQARTYYAGSSLMRVDTGAPGNPPVSTSISNWDKRKMVLLSHPSKECIVFNLTGQGATPRQSTRTSIFDELRQIPDSGVESIGTKKIDGIDAVGFRANRAGVSYDIWAAPDTHRLLLVERENDTIKGLKSEIRDFEFDAKYDDSLFNLEPPEGYKVVDGQTLEVTVPSEESFINFLKTHAEEAEGSRFLPSLSAADIKKAGTTPKAVAKDLTLSEGIKRSGELSAGLTFVGQMTPENDFHYAGGGVALGESQKPICWYKPTGRKNYHVIYGDLSVKETVPADLPSSTSR